jgi:hypothetical protein
MIAGRARQCLHISAPRNDPRAVAGAWRLASIARRADGIFACSGAGGEGKKVLSALVVGWSPLRTVALYGQVRLRTVGWFEPRISTMPIRPFLAGQAFEPETIRDMSLALERVCDALCLKCRRRRYKANRGKDHRTCPARSARRVITDSNDAERVQGRGLKSGLS